MNNDTLYKRPRIQPANYTYHYGLGIVHSVAKIKFHNGLQQTKSTIERNNEYGLLTKTIVQQN